MFYNSQTLWWIFLFRPEQHHRASYICSYHWPLSVVWNTEVDLFLISIFLPFKGTACVHIRREKLRRNSNDPETLLFQTAQILVSFFLHSCAKIVFEPSYARTLWGAWRYGADLFCLIGWLYYFCYALEMVKKLCATFPQNSISVVEQSSGRQVTLNCHCEGHLVVYKSACIVFW